MLHGREGREQERKQFGADKSFALGRIRWNTEVRGRVAQRKMYKQTIDFRVG